MLVEGHQFGEIGLLFNCKRTASIMTKNYAILARISKENFREVVSEEPIFKKMMMRQVYQYNDPNIKFLKKTMSELPFIKKCGRESIYSILFSL